MTATRTPFWHDEAFAEFLPHIKATAAWDKRHGNSPRFDLKPGTPGVVVSRALALRGACAECGQAISPFRARMGKDKRGTSGNVYLAATCPLDVRIGCSRGRRASVAYAAIWDLVRGAQSDAGTQSGLL